MSYEKYYPGGWQSGESGGTPITPEALNHIENGIKQTYSDFAPAGYGLGTTAKELTKSDDLNNIWQNGNYWWNWSTPANAPVFDWSANGAYGYMRVDNRDDGAYTQTIRSFHAPNIGLTIIRTKTGDTIIEEWVNPPMVPGVEYRTTERYDGKAVYKKKVSVGALPNATVKTFANLISGFTGVVDYQLTGYSSAAILHPTDVYYFNTTHAGITLNATSDLSPYSGIAYLAYIKD